LAIACRLLPAPLIGRKLLLSSVGRFLPGIVRGQFILIFQFYRFRQFQPDDAAVLRQRPSGRA
jgi:hypothetical protein